MTKRAIEKLSRLLEIERSALIQGDLDKVMELIPEKEQLAQQFDGDNAVALKALSMKLSQNARLLAAARDGVSDVVTTLRRQRSARTTLSSYDQSGKPTQIVQSHSKTERRF